MTDVEELKKKAVALKNDFIKLAEDSGDMTLTSTIVFGKYAIKHMNSVLNILEKLKEE